MRMNNLHIYVNWLCVKCTFAKTQQKEKKNQNNLYLHKNKNYLLNVINREAKPENDEDEDEKEILYTNKQIKKKHQAFLSCMRLVSEKKGVKDVQLLCIQ